MNKDTLIKLIATLEINLQKLHNEIRHIGAMNPSNEWLHAKYDRLNNLKQSYELTLNGGVK